MKIVHNVTILIGVMLVVFGVLTLKLAVLDSATMVGAWTLLACGIIIMQLGLVHLTLDDITKRLPPKVDDNED